MLDAHGKCIEFNMTPESLMSLRNGLLDTCKCTRSPVPIGVYGLDSGTGLMQHYHDLQVQPFGITAASTSFEYCWTRWVLCLAA